MVSDNRKKMTRFLALSTVFFLAACGSYSKAVTITAAKSILNAAVAYSSTAEMDGKSYKMHAEVLTKKTEGFLTTTFSSSLTDVTYYFDTLATDAWTTWRITYNKVVKASPDADEITTNYVVTRDSTGNVYYVSDNGGTSRSYDAVKDSFLANYFHLPSGIICQDSLTSAKYAMSLLSLVEKNQPNNLKSYSTISNGGSDLSVDFTGSEFDFSTLFSEEGVNLSNASYFSAHFSDNLVNSMKAGYDFTEEGSTSSSASSAYPEGNYAFSVAVTFST